jgi:hypothetical protein
MLNHRKSARLPPLLARVGTEGVGHITNSKGRTSVAKTVTVDFWDVHDMNGAHMDLFPLLLEAGIAGLADRMKTRSSAQIDYLVESVSRSHSSAIAGTAALIRTEDWPEEVTLGTGQLDPLALANGKALAEEMSFHYDRGLRVLVTQRHRLFRASRLVQLLIDITGTAFVIQPKLRQDAFERLRRMSRIGKVELKFHGPISPVLTGVLPSVAQAIDATRDEVQAIDVGLSFTMGRLRSQSLAVQKCGKSSPAYEATKIRRAWWFREILETTRQRLSILYMTDSCSPARLNTMTNSWIE